VDENALLNPSLLGDSYTTFSESLASDELLAELSDFIEHTQPSKPRWKRQPTIKKNIQPDHSGIGYLTSPECFFALRQKILKSWRRGKIGNIY